MYVRDILDMQAATQAWKFMNNLIPAALASFYEKGNDRNHTLKTNKFKTDRLRNISSIEYSIRIWNSLPLDLKQMKTRNAFKKGFCRWKIDNYE